MKHIRLILILLVFLNFHGCIVNYVPDNISENEEMLVVEGLITDQAGINTIKLSISQPLWRNSSPKALRGCIVSISDDLGQTYSLKESATYGIYMTDPVSFQGVAGRSYTLHIKTAAAYGNLNYESIPMKMRAVPPIDRIYYEKKIYAHTPMPVEGCQIYLDTHDPAGKCNFYRWKYSETWEYHLPFDVKNRICWKSDNSSEIFIKSTSTLAEDRIVGLPLNSITNPVDKLSVKYSIQVQQYSLNEEEYQYWERIKNTSGEVGGLYDVIPAIIPNNIFCIENQNEKVLGYFSVSAVSSKRFFIKDSFAGINVKYEGCISDTIYGTEPIPGLDATVWVIIDHSDLKPPMRIITYSPQCGDCRTTGTNVKPVFWDDDKL
jgi:hypothetical protein